MKITADTDLLLRAILEDDAAQAEEAQTLIGVTEPIAVPVVVFCEMTLGGTVLATFDRLGRGVLESAGLLAADPATRMSEN